MCTSDLEIEFARSVYLSIRVSFVKIPTRFATFRRPLCNAPARFTDIVTTGLVANRFGFRRSHDSPRQLTYRLQSGPLQILFQLL